MVSMMFDKFQAEIQQSEHGALTALREKFAKFSAATGKEREQFYSADELKVDPNVSLKF